MNAIAGLLCATLLLGAGPQEVGDYARREAAAPELSEFEGGFYGAAIVLIGVVIGGLIATSMEDCALCGRARVEVLPAWEGAPPPAPELPTR